MFCSSCHAHKAVAIETEAISSEYKLIKCSISNTDEINEDENITLPSSELMEIMNTIDMIERSRCINFVVIGWREARTRNMPALTFELINQNYSIR